MSDADTAESRLGEAGTIPWRSPTMVGIVASAIVTPMAVPLVGPALPAVRAALDITKFQAGLLITVYAVPGVFLAPIAGMIADRVGRKDLLVVCLLGYGLAGSAIALTSTFRVVLLLRFAQGCTAGSIIFSLVVTLVGDHFDGADRNAVMGVTTAGLTLGVAVYPALGGYLSSIRWNLPFAVYGLSALVGGYVWLTLVEPDIDGGPLSLSYFREVYAAVPIREAAGLYGIIFSREIVFFGAIFTALPFLLEESFALGTTEIGALTSGMLAITAVVSTQNGRLARRFTDATLVAAGFLGYALGLVGVGLAGTPGAVLTALVLFGIGHGLGSPALFTALTDLVSTPFRGGVVSLRTVTTATGQALGPVFFTVPVVLVGYHGLMVAGGVAAALTAAAAFPLLRR